MQNYFRSTQTFDALKGLNLRLIGVLGAIACIGAGAGYYVFQAVTTPEPEPVAVAAPVTTVTSLGRLEPQGQVIKLSVANAQDSRVNQLLVQEGEYVTEGQVIAILQGLDKKQAELVEAEQNVAIARARLAQVQAGDAKQAEIAAQQANLSRLDAQLRTEQLERDAEIARVEAELRNAEANFQRYQRLYQEGAVSAADLDTYRRNMETAQAQLEVARAQRSNTVATLQQQIQQERSVLAQLSEVRPTDVQVVQAELDYALVQVERARADLEDFYVRVPIDGQIIKINTRVGEQVNTSEGIVELAQTDQMYAIAEVYETDISEINVGQRATIVSENGGFEGEIHGVVDHIGLQIGKQNVLDSDPAADTDARVVEVKVRIDPEDSPQVAGLTNMQVRVRIDLDR